MLNFKFSYNYRFFFILIFFLLTQCKAEYQVKKSSGEILIAPSFANKLNPSDILFIITYPASSEKKSESLPESAPSFLKEKPLLIKKLSPVLFPMSFEISEKDILFPENKAIQKFNIVARLSRNNSAVAQIGDLEGIYAKSPVQFGEKNIRITLIDELKEEDLNKRK